LGRTAVMAAGIEASNINVSRRQAAIR